MLRPRAAICFVCGSPGAEHALYSNSRDDGPYFPFLKHHDPPCGCLPPGPDGIIKSCNVCYFFLIQQWDSFEKTKTPHLKRLYWLKRADDRQFTGAEPNIQGEYVAQIMGVPYNGNGFTCFSEVDAKVPSSSAKITDSENIGYSSPWKTGPVFSGLKNSQTKASSATPMLSGSKKNVESRGSLALDLTIGKPCNKNDVMNSAEPKKLKAASNDDQRMSGTKQDDSKDSFICFSCGEKNLVAVSRTVCTKPQKNNLPYFPFLERIKPPKGAMALSDQGVTIVCHSCRKALYRQWNEFQDKITSSDMPNYVANFGNVLGASNTVREPDMCYICGETLNSETRKKIHTKLDNGDWTRMYLPFLANISSASGAKGLDAKGRVNSCQRCYKSLKSQWKNHCEKRTPVVDQSYQLPTRPSMLNSSSRSSTIDPISVEVSSCGGTQTSSSTQSVGLLAIVPHHHTSLNTMVGGLAPDRLLSAASDSDKEVSLILTKSSGPPSGVQSSENSLSGETQTCFLCGIMCQVGQVVALSSCPKKVVIGERVAPFFPFLSNHQPAEKAEPISEEGTVIVCVLCSLNLINQWKDYELSQDIKDRNRWLRSYTYSELSCFICSVRFARTRARVITIERFPFLETHHRPPKSLVVDGGSSVVICLDCHTHLNTQFEEYEKMGLPVSMRKYNWVMNNRLSVEEKEGKTSVKIKQEEEEERAELLKKQSSENVESSNVNHDKGNNAESSSDDGLPPGSKPVSTSMLNPAVNKVQRTTATVPPLNQVSPNNAAMNATRNSSFAAALRKLAKQAGEDGSAHESSDTGSSATSPRSVTPKRGPPPPLIYSSTSSSSINSPPVVTIAPTLSQLSLGIDSRRTCDRPLHATSTTDSHRHEHPGLSHTRRDDERTTSNSESSSRRLSSSHPLAHVSSSHEEYLRGFQPYRHGEEFRGFLPPPFSLDPAIAAAAAAYPYSGFMAHPLAASHNNFRLDDPLLLERYRLMGLQMPYFPFAQPGLMAHPGIHPLMAAGMRYPPDLLQQQMALMSPSYREVERQRLEEELRRKEREKEEERERERKLEIEREREQERLREIEKQKELEKEKMAREEARREVEKFHAQSMGRLGSGSMSLLQQYEAEARLKEERHKELIQDQIAREHSIFARERGRRQEPEKRDRGLDLSCHSSQAQTLEVPPLQMTESSKSGHKFYRPFEKEPPNGIISESHAVEHERRILNERILIEGRSLLTPNGNTGNKEKFTEGIHARLLENEAARKHSKSSATTSSYNQYDYDCKHPDFNFYLESLKKETDKKLAAEKNGPKPCVSDLIRESHCRSKLDLEEEWRHESRMNGDYDSGDDYNSAEETRTQKLLLVVNIAPMKQDYSKAKLKFLSNFNLITPAIKSKIDYQKRQKRKRMYRERSKSPVEVEEDLKENTLTTIIRPEELNRAPDYKSKAKFLKNMGLENVSLEKRRKMQHVQQVCQVEKARREAIPSKIRSDNSHLLDNKLEFSSNKRKHDSKEESPSKKMSAEQSSSQRISLGQLAAQRAQKTTNRAIIFPEARDKTHNAKSREFAQEFHQSVLQTTRQQQEMASKIGSKHEDSAFTRSSESHHQSPAFNHASSSAHSPRIPSHSLASHSSTTSEPSASSRHIPHSLMHPFRDLPHVSSNQSGSTSQTSPRYDNSAVFKWPGIEVLMEAYQRHVDEWQPRLGYPPYSAMMHDLHRQLPGQSLDRQILHENNDRLNSSNAALFNATSQNLSLRMTDLMQNKQQLDAEQEKSAIDNLKQCFKHLR